MNNTRHTATSSDLAAALAHRACHSNEHDPLNGKVHGYCMVCGVQWPCDTAKYFLRAPKTQTDRERSLALTLADVLQKLYSVANKYGDRSCDYDVCGEVRAARDLLSDDQGVAK